MNKDAVVAGQAIYSKSVLAIYDLWVLGFSNHYLWKCPTKLIAEQFAALTSANHLDVGVGTGYYLKHHLPAHTRRIALMDLNENSLASASAVVRHLSPEIYCRNVLAPLELTCDGFDSVSVNYLLHCLPGIMAEKCVLFTHLESVMKPGAVLFGSTILGTGITPNAFAARLMAIYNKKGIFCNQADDIDTLTQALSARFDRVSIKQVGCVALFSAVKR
ncbi:methyltransferase domain-containing protein [Shewanella aegiceratis]|uniref:methyltransferase domain-containing protein n=1 Tax=Shewanella aegiceratis TaxID=2864203 RepID=UPI001C659555|nr:class I SAM-dependent methyltransferase [Shewanella aegiceratis]QYJ83019.1 class I SAM-dependent methyltransferase [Shewanella aegiceratis]